MNKRNKEILRNIQLLCFIEPKLIKNLSDILKNNLKDENEEKLFDYLNKNWLKEDPKIFNYYNIIKKEYKGIIAHLYLTNNIAESINSKISKLIPKTKLSPNDFINVMKNILTHNEIKKQNIIRKDYIAKALANIAPELEENDLEWLKYDQFKIKLKNLLEEEEQGKNNVNIITEMIDKLDLLEENESNIEESNKIKSEEENSELEDEISNLNENNNDINNKNVDNIDLINEEEEKKDNNNLENENEIDNNSNISETNNINSIDELCSNYELHKASLLDRLLINKN